MKQVTTFLLASTVLLFTGCTPSNEATTPPISIDSVFKKAVCATDPNLTTGTYYEFNTPATADYQGETLEYYGVLKVGDQFFPLKEDGTFLNTELRVTEPDTSKATQLTQCS